MNIGRQVFYKPFWKTLYAIIAISLVFSHCKKVEYLNLDYSYQAIDQNEVAFKLNSPSNGEMILIINFFAPNCPPCITELPELRRFYDQVKSESGTKLIAIGSLQEIAAHNLGATVDEQLLEFAEIKKQVTQFSLKYKTDYPVYLSNAQGLKAMRVSKFPETLVFYKTDKGYSLRRKFTGAIKAKDLQTIMKTKNASTSSY